MTVSIDQVIERVPAWSGRSLEVTSIVGGLTNRIYRVDVDRDAFVVRIPGEGTDCLAIDRANELFNTRAAASAGVSPRVIHHLADLDVLVLEFIHAETLTIPVMKREGMPTDVARVLRQLHEGPRFLHDFNMFDLTRQYLGITRERAIPIPEGFLQAMPQVERIESVFVRNPVATVPCHNDLLAANILDDGQRLWLIDFEYSGNNDPTFELGNTCQEQEYDDPRVVEMCASYFGEPSPDKLARMKLNMIMSDVGWSLWAAIQAEISAIDYDFWGWAVERWARAQAGMASPEFATNLRAVEAPSR